MEIILGKTAGFCYGVNRAVNGVKEEIGNNVCCLGEIVHNKNVVKSLEEQGIRFIEDIEEADSKTIIRAHGVPKQVYERAKEKNIELKDLTCPSVLKIQKMADEYSKNGYFIILTGKKNHPEVIGIESHCGQEYVIISGEEEIELAIKQINEKNLNNVVIISQTTFSSKAFDKIVDVIQSNIDNSVNLKVEKTICTSTEIRQKETEEIAKKVDVMIIIGDKMSSNTTKLYNISCDFCKKVIFVSDESELDLKLLNGVQTIGIMAGASTPREDIEKVKNAIGGMK